MLFSKVWRSRFLGCCIVVIACAGCAGPEEQVFASSLSPGRQHKVTVTVTEPWAPHGRYRIRVYVETEAGGLRQEVASRPLENDGVPFTEKNIAVRWIAEHMALICLRPTDLPDEGIRVIVKDQVVAEIVKQC